MTLIGVDSAYGRMHLGILINQLMVFFCGHLQVVVVASLPKELADIVHPEEGRHVRGFLLQSGWVIEQVEDDSDSCLVTYVSQVLAFCTVRNSICC